MGFRTLKGDILASSRYGVWGYQFYGRDMQNEIPHGYWEVYHGWPVATSALTIIENSKETRSTLFISSSVIEKSWVHVCNNKLYWKTVSFLPRQLEKLHKMGCDNISLLDDQGGDHANSHTISPCATLNNMECMVWCFKQCKRVITNKIRSLFFYDQWTLMLKIGPTHGIPLKMYKFKEIIPPKDRLWADPFVVYHNGMYVVYFEELVFNSGKGHISCIRIDKEGDHSFPIKVLEKPYHLSYPFVFRHDGEFYMIPETAQNHSVELYKCTCFPDRWIFVKTLMKNVRAGDTTLFKKDDMWWLFANMCENAGASIYDELFLFYSTDLYSDTWTPHPLNPVVSDARAARPAGRIFLSNSKMYRPTHNYTADGKWEIRVNEILTLTKTEYRQRYVNKIVLDWHKPHLGIHTYNCEEDMTVIDVLSRRRRFF